MTTATTPIPSQAPAEASEPRAPVLGLASGSPFLGHVIRPCDLSAAARRLKCFLGRPVEELEKLRVAYGRLATGGALEPRTLRSYWVEALAVEIALTRRANEKDEPRP